MTRVRKGYWNGIFTGGLLGLLLGVAVIGSARKDYRRTIVNTASEAPSQAKRWAIRTGKDLGRTIGARMRRV